MNLRGVQAYLFKEGIWVCPAWHEGLLEWACFGSLSDVGGLLLLGYLCSSP